MSRAALVSSLSTRSSVSVPTLTCSRPAGQALVASLVGSPGWPTMTMRFHCNGSAVNLCDQRVEQEVLVLGIGRVFRLPRLRGRQDPAHRCGLAGCVDEAKRIQAVERAVAEP